MAASIKVSPPSAQISFVRSFLVQTMPKPTPSSGNTRPADGQMYPRSK